MKTAYVLKTWRVGMFVWKGPEHKCTYKAIIKARTAEEALQMAKERGIVAPVIEGVYHAG